MKLLLAHAAMLAAIIPLAFAGAARADAPAPVGSVVDVKGPVTIRDVGATAFHDAVADEKLFPGEEIKTGAQGYAHLLWANGGDFQLLPEGDLVIPQEEGVLINAGKIWAEFQHKLLVPFFFRAPSANAVVRGTILGVEVLSDGRAHVAVLEGKVEVADASGHGHVMLGPGQAVTVSPFGMLGPTEPVTRPEWDQGPRRLNGAIRPTPHPGGHEAPPPPDGDRRGGFDWLRQHRAAVRLEAVRQQARDRAGHPMPRPDGDRRHDGRELDDTAGAWPKRAFPDGRPRDGYRMPPPPDCQPVVNPDGSVSQVCPPPPPPDHDGDMR